MESTDKKLTIGEFVLRAIDTLAKDGRKTIHVVYSGFNQGFREYFPGEDPVEAVKTLAKDGKIDYRLARGGAIIGRLGSIKAPSSPDVGRDTLKKMGIEFE
jgi:hypothetical protein